jgi:enoyl-CoA hydratase/carnithine racemase
MAEALIKFERAGDVCIVTLNREPKLNTLTPAMLNELEAHARAIDADRDIRVVILTGAGSRAFCVGADITQWAALEALDMWRQWVKRGHQVFDQWARLRQPVIAAINGHAFGGGLELAISADIRIATTAAQYALPEASIATCPGWSGSQRMVRLIGGSQTKYLAISGQRLSATQALNAGLVHEVVEADGLMVRAKALAADMANKAPISLQLTKQLVNAATGEDRDAVLEAMAGALAASTQDAAEGIASFKEKRKAAYIGH